MTAFASADLYRSLTSADPPAGLLDAVSAGIRRYTGWHITPQRSETLVVDGTGGSTLLLPTAHLVEVVALVNDGIEVDPVNLEWSSSGIVRLRTPSRFSPKLGGVAITVLHGWDMDAVTDLGILTVLVAARVAASPHGETVSQVGGVSFQLVATGSSFTEGEMIALNSYCIAGR